jgi:ElaB/YqjD/DUF883 family membrane-anchored ribosome-binding protein
MATTGPTGAKGAGNERKATTEDLEADIARLREDIAKLAKQFTAAGEHSMNAARRAATEGVDQLRARGEAAIEDFKLGARDLEAEIVANVREKPLTSLAIAAGVGYLFALISRR